MNMIAFIMGLPHSGLFIKMAAANPARTVPALPGAGVFTWAAVMLLLIFAILAGCLAVTPILIHMRRDRHPESSE